MTTVVGQTRKLLVSACRPGAQMRRQMIEALVPEILVEPPALDLIEHLVEFRTRYRLIDETLAAAEFAEVPMVDVFELRRHRKLPQRQISGKIGVERSFGAIERAQIASHDVGRRMLRHPPQRMKSILDDLAQAELFGHRDLRRQQARGLDLAVEQGAQARAEAAGIDGLDVLKG